MSVTKIQLARGRKLHKNLGNPLKNYFTVQIVASKQNAFGMTISVCQNEEQNEQQGGDGSHQTLLKK